MCIYIWENGCLIHTCLYFVMLGYTKYTELKLNWICNRTLMTMFVFLVPLQVFINSTHTQHRHSHPFVLCVKDKQSVLLACALPPEDPPLGVFWCADEAWMTQSRRNQLNTTPLRSLLSYCPVAMLFRQHQNAENDCDTCCLKCFAFLLLWKVSYIVFFVSHKTWKQAFYIHKSACNIL